MALVAGSKFPRCFSCLRRSLQNDMPSLFSPTQIQIRGKKKLPRRTTITVRLLENVKAHGPKGTILATAPARMRNHLYPRAQAAYMTAAEIKHAEANELVMERDAGYGTERTVEKGEVKRQLVYDMSMVTPQRAYDLLDKTVPDMLEFQRKPIAAQGDSANGESFIYGSVSSLDIATDINAQLARKSREDGFADAAKVVLSSHDIQVDLEGINANIAEPERIKALGMFNITINVKNGESLARKVRVTVLQGQS